MDQLTQTRAKYVAEMQRLLDLYRKTNLIPEESEILKRFDAAWPPMEAACKQVRDLSYADTRTAPVTKKRLRRWPRNAGQNSKW